MAAAATRQGAISAERPRKSVAASGPWRDLALAAAVVLVVMAPALFTSGGFAADFTNHLWAVWVAGRELARGGRPDYFLNVNGSAVFYPYFAFYGGTLYNATGALADVLGDRPVAAFVGVTTIAVAGCYGGMWWLGRQLGLRGWLAHTPALVVVTSAYYITNLYGRGAWTELVATSAIAPMVAAGLHLVRAPAWRPLPVLVFVIATVVFTGSHNITLLWGTTMLAVGAIVLWAALGVPRGLPWRRLAMVAALGVGCALVNAWFLLPDVLYARDTLVGGTVLPPGATFFDTVAVMLNPLRYVPSVSSTPGLYVQVPDWFLAWGLAAGAVLMWRAPPGDVLRRAWGAMVAMVAIVLALMLVMPLWTAMPSAFLEIQFPYRLGSYLFYATGGLVLVGALALQRAGPANGERPTRERRGLRWVRAGLLVASAVSAGLCVWQLWVPNDTMPKLTGGLTLAKARSGHLETSYLNRYEVLVGVDALPFSWYDQGSYGDGQAPVVVAPNGRSLTIEPDEVRDGHFSGWVNAPPGSAPIETNIDGGAYIVQIKGGLERVGRTAQGFTVVRRRRDGGRGPVHVTVEATHDATIALAWALTLAATAALAILLAALSLRAARERRATRSG